MGKKSLSFQKTTYTTYVQVGLKRSTFFLIAQIPTVNKVLQNLKSP